MKYVELLISLACWGIAILWFKNSPSDDFPYEPAISALLGLSSFFDSLRRFGLFDRVRLMVRDPKITPWLFSGGKVNKTNISVELILDNNKETDVLLRSIVIECTPSIEDAIGVAKNEVRFMDMDKLSNVLLPINVPAKSSKTILVESTHDASSVEKYRQASKFSELVKSENFKLTVTYSLGSKERKAILDFNVNTENLLVDVRSNYEKSGDYQGVKLIEKI